MARVLVGTPAGGGQVTVQYLLSFMDTTGQSGRHNGQVIQALREGKITEPQAVNDTINLGLYTLSNESLLARGRNHIAQHALTNGWEKLFFIDADAGWNFGQFAKIALSDKPIVAGICPLKTYPISMNYLPFLDDEKYFNDAQRSYESTQKMREDKKLDVMPVAFVGTAFLCIDIKVLKHMAETVPQYQYPNPYTGNNETHWAFFDGGPVDNTYFSEDWAFCDKARELGYDINIDTSVVISHTGTHTFRAV